MWRELVRTNDAVLDLGRPGAARRRRDSASRARPEHERARGLARHLAAPHTGRRCCVDDARQLLEEAGLGHELRPDVGVEVDCDDAVLGGRLLLKQPRRGHRVGHDAILLAAACPARARRTGVDLGAGVGAAGLALALRVDDGRVTLVEIDPGLAALAAENARAQRTRRAGAVPSCSTSRRRRVPSPPRGSRLESVTRVLMNPPFNDPARQRASPDRSAAWRMRPGGDAGRLDQDRARGCCVRAERSP